MDQPIKNKLKLSVYPSFEAAAAAEIAEAAQRSPLDNLRYATELIARIYGLKTGEFRKREKLKIKIISYDESCSANP